MGEMRAKESGRMERADRREAWLKRTGRWIEGGMEREVSLWSPQAGTLYPTHQMWTRVPIIKMFFRIPIHGL